MDQHTQFLRMEAAAKSHLAAETERYSAIVGVVGSPDDANLVAVASRMDPHGGRQMLVDRLKAFSPTFKDARIGAIADPAAFNAVCDRIYSDAEAAMRAYSGPLKAVATRDASGHGVTRFFGDGCWDAFSGGTRFGRIIRQR